MGSHADTTMRPPGAGYASHLRGGGVRVGREDHSEDREERVRAGVRERQRSGLTCAERDVEPAFASLRARDLEQARCWIDARDTRTALGH